MPVLKRYSSKLILPVFYLMITLFLVACGDKHNPDITSAPHPINIIPTTAAESPKISVGLDPSIALGTVVDNSSRFGQTTTQNIASDGFARIAYYDHPNGDLKLAQCAKADCTTNTIATIDR